VCRHRIPSAVDTCFGTFHTLLNYIDDLCRLILAELLYDDSDLLVLHAIRHSVTANLCIQVNAGAGQELADLYAPATPAQEYTEAEAAKIALLRKTGRMSHLAQAAQPSESSCNAT